MESSSSTTKVKEGKKVFNVQLTSNDIKQLKFRLILDLAYKQNPFGTLSMIPL